VYVADSYNDRIQKFSSTGTFITAMAMIREKEGWGALPSGIAVAADGSVYVAIKSISRIQRFEAWK
jgi:sugar lactone lactonase YvrE